jgi:hypothetical protein
MKVQKQIPLIFLFLFSCILLALRVSAQNSITGKVLNEQNEQPLVGASVYINNSTIGTTTNEAGEFKISSLPNGYYEIVVSYVGFEILVYRITIQSRNMSLLFKLEPKPTEMRKVVVLSRDTRAKWLKVMRENFLGITEAARKTKIMNEDDILFEEGSGKNQVKAFSAAPLEVVNKELGYRIYFELVGFYYNAEEGRTYFYGYSRFEELNEKGKTPNRYIRNRERYYKGSTLHFFHSLIDNRVKEEGFMLLNVQSMANAASGKNVLIDSSSRSPSIKVSGGRSIGVGMATTRDNIFRKDSVDGNEVYVLDWKETLRVSYGKDPFVKRHLTKTILMQGSLPVGVYSNVDMLERPVYMDSNGTLYNPLALQMRGYWAYEKLANMLPMNYRPGD